MKALLRNARESKGLKTIEVARSLQIDQALISKFESGQRRPTKSQIIKLSELLNIDRKTLLTAWLTEKILHEIEGQEFAVEAINAVGKTLNPNSKSDSKTDPVALQKLLDEMDALKHKFEGLRGA
jgi:transcriptional regulator with XRE-family HTH domain